MNGVHTVFLHALHHHLRLDVARVFFPGGVDVRHQGDIRRLGAGEIVLEQPLHPAVGVGLHYRPKTVVGLHGRYAQGIAHFGGVMAVVVIQLDPFHDAGQLKAAVCACKLVQRPAGNRHIRPQLMGTAQRRQRVGHLKETGYL